MYECLSSLFGQLRQPSDNSIVLINVYARAFYNPTAPLLTHAVMVDIPKATSQPNITQQPSVQLAILADGQLMWNGEAVGQDAFALHLRNAAQMNPRTELHIRADKSIQYRYVA